MQHDIDLKELNFDLLTPRVRGLGSESKIFTTELLHLWFSFLIWYASWPCSERVEFDLLTQSPEGGLQPKYLLPCCCISWFPSFDMQQWLCSEKGWILTYWSHPKGRGRGAAVKIFGTMLMHSWLQLIWYATWPWRNSQIRLFNICPECSKVPSPRRWPSWAPMAFFSIVSKKIALQLGKLEKPSHQSISILTLCLGAQKNRLNEAIPLSIHNMFSITDIKATFQLLKQWDHSP